MICNFCDATFSKKLWKTYKISRTFEKSKRVKKTHCRFRNDTLCTKAYGN